MKSEILGRGSGTNYNHTNNLLKGFAAAKLMFPMVVQVQPNPVRTALQLILMLGPSQHLRQAAQHWFGFVYLCFPFISWLKIWFWGTILKTFKLISPANSSPKLRPHFFFFLWILLWELMSAQPANKMDSSGLWGPGTVNRKSIFRAVDRYKKKQNVSIIILDV